MSSLNHLIDALYLSIFFIVLLFVFIVLMIVRFYNLKELNKNKIYGAIVNAQENERKRIAMELHDSLGNVLLSTKLKIIALSDQDNLVLIKQDLLQVADHLAEASQITRITSHSLMPEVLIHYDLKSALNELISQNTGTIQINFTYHSDLKIPQFLELNVFRIIAELITNAIKYSKADRIDLKISVVNNSLQLLFSDNGIGFDFKNILYNTKGIGLKNIKNRIDFLNGELNFKNVRGACFTIKIPIHEQ